MVEVERELAFWHSRSARRLARMCSCCTRASLVEALRKVSIPSAHVVASCAPCRLTGKGLCSAGVADFNVFLAGWLWRRHGTLSQRWLRACTYFSLEEQFGRAAAVWSEAYCSIAQQEFLYSSLEIPTLKSLHALFEEFIPHFNTSVLLRVVDCAY